MLNKIKSYLKSNKLKDFIIYGFGQVINIASPLLITPYLIYVCGIENLGVIAIGQSFAYILNVIIDYSSYILGVKNISLNRDDNSSLEHIFTTNYYSKVVLLTFVYLFILLLIIFIPYFNNNALVLLYSSSIIIAQFINPTWFFQGVENFKWISFMNILSKVIFIACIFIFVREKSDFILANLFLGLGAIIANSIGLLKIINKYNFSLKRLDIAAVKELLKKDLSFTISQLFFSIRNYSSVILISYFSGNYIAGQFKVIEQIVNLFRTYLQMFFKFSYSFVCFEIDKNLKRGLGIWKKINLLNLFFVFLLLVLTYLFSKEVLTFFKVDKDIFIQLQNYLQIALILPLLIGVSLAIEQLLFSLNKNKVYIKSTIFITILNVVGIAVFCAFYNLKEVFLFLLFIESLLIFIYSIILKPTFKKI
ncbi:oligosaccharide flippase family protein [Mariniflexile soesokkakense]|uniref:Oligosaccharide flippase family protein n=1 Tax=Mariniflexile soesokkakense TaxID=1343160 RepID=A0ABV0AD38_9FLAO